MAPKEETVETVSEDGSNANAVASRESSSSDLKTMGKDGGPQRKIVSLEERGKIPNSFYLSVTLILTMHFCADIWSPHVLQDWVHSMHVAGIATRDTLVYLRDLTQAVFEGKVTDWVECGKAFIFTGLVGSLLYVLFVAPFRAGFWTGSRSSKHKMHRYMGLAYLVQYFAVWTNFLVNYESTQNSYLSHFIALNGIIQGYSAFFSFKVLPELADPGYYSDKAVASRSFVHENIFFSMMCVFGSMYYNDEFRAKVQSHIAGQIVEAMFVFFPYILIRTWFPVTQFSAAGTTRNGRSSQNMTFYTIGTKMVKFFYLWAKYFLGFFINFLVYLGAPTPEQSKFIYGMYLLNLGTISIAIFLHTLRFKKVLPGKLTFSIYLLQIYATFSAIPLAYDMFISHKLLCGLCFSGILLNMTRSRPIHGVWCCIAFYLLKMRTDIEW